MASLPVMTFLSSDATNVIATFPQAALEFVHPGDGVEIAFDRLPGRILSGSVQAVVPATGQGQLPPSGTLMEWTTTPVPGRFAVVLELDDIGDLTLPAGASGVAAVYTDRAQAIPIIRQVMIRMTT
jgi:multidrug resistance efflux pump